MINQTRKVIAITGASSGIGKAIAFGLAAESKVLCLIGRNMETLSQISDSLRNTGVHTQCYQCNLAIKEDIIKLAKSIANDFGRLDILVHGAGEISLGSFETARVDDLDRQFQINVRAPFLLTQSLLPLIKENKGQIVFINSSAVMNSNANNGQYAATKHALKALSDNLRNEVNKYGVRVLSVYPGRTATPMQAKIYKTEGKIYAPERLLQPEDVASVVIHSLSLPSTAEVTDISIRPMQK